MILDDDFVQAIWHLLYFETMTLGKKSQEKIKNDSFTPKDQKSVNN